VISLTLTQRATLFLLPPATLLVFTACGSQPVKADVAQESGVTGVSVVDSGCPVLKQGENCPDKPMPARLSVTPINSSEVVAKVDTGPDGAFRIPLTSGSYTMTPQNMSGAPLPYSAPISFDVHEREFTTVMVRFDSGVR
jgi:hypothetical protein